VCSKDTDIEALAPASVFFTIVLSCLVLEIGSVCCKDKVVYG